MFKTSFKVALFSILLFGATAAQAADEQTFDITMKDGVFSPASIDVPADQKIHLIVKNEDHSRIEFESDALNVEEKIAHGQQKDIYVGPLKAGSYTFINDFNQNATGVLIAK